MLYITTLVAALASAVAAQKGGGGCSPLHLVYARATTEPPASFAPGQFDTAAARTWSKGYGAAGKSLLSNITALLPSATGYPVHYPASMGGGSPQQGVQDAIRHMEQKAAACPGIKFAMGGHSQGGFVTTGAIPKLPRNVLSKVVAVTMFGSPACPAAVRDRCISYCESGDPVCSGRGGGKMGGGKMGKMGGGGKMGKFGGMGKGKMGGMGKMGSEERMISDIIPNTPDDLVRALSGLTVAQLSAAAPDCARYSSVRTSGLGKGGHLGYNKDGTYVRAAACYVVAKYKSSGGR